MKRKIIEVLWMDACTHTGWQSSDYKASTVWVTTIGVEWENNKEYIAVALNIDEQGQPADIISIPKSCIKKVKVVKT
jgi:hypothetical protein